MVLDIEYMGLVKRACFGVLVYLLLAVQGNAFIVDFETPETGSGIFAAPSIGVDQTITNANGSGVDVTINVDTGPSTEPNDFINGTPEINNTQFNRPGFGNILLVDADFEGPFGSQPTESFEFTFSFTGLVTEVTINIIDIDRGNDNGDMDGDFTFQDQIRGIAASGTGVSGPVLSAPGSDATVVGSTILGVATNGSQTLNGFENDLSAAGDVSITFTGTDIDQIVFFYAQGPDAELFSVTQRIGIESIAFTVPEASAWSALVSLLLFIMFSRSWQPRLGTKIRV